MSNSKIEQIRALLKSIETGDPEPVSVVNEEKYIQHNPQTHEGSEGLATLFKRLSKTEPRVNMIRGFEDGRAVEHWDNIQERSGPNSSGHSMVDGVTAVGDIEHTEINRGLVKAFVESVLIAKEVTRLLEFVNEGEYVEHNPDFGDDLTALKSALTASGAQETSLDYYKLHRVLAQGNFVLTVCEGERNAEHTSFYDLFRTSNGRIVEHWDTTEKVAPKDQWKNDNGKF